MIIIAIIIGIALIFGLVFALALLNHSSLETVKKKARQLIAEGNTADVETARRVYRRLANLPASMRTLEVDRLCEDLRLFIQYREKEGQDEQG